MNAKVIEITYDIYTNSWIVAPLDEKGFQVDEYEYVATKKEAMAIAEQMAHEHNAEIHKYTKTGKLQK